MRVFPFYSHNCFLCKLNTVFLHPLQNPDMSQPQCTPALKNKTKLWVSGRT